MDLDKIKSISILSVARDLGLTPVRVGSYYTLKEYDSVRISPKYNNFFRNSNGAKGSVIDFVMEFGQVDMESALRYLSDKSGEAIHVPNIKKEKKEKDDKVLKLPQRASSNSKAINYLSENRGIDEQIIDEFIKNGNLYQDNRNNCVFVSYDKSTPKFACFRGTTEKRFLGDVSGCSYKHCIYINNDSNTLIISESVIDSMSIMSIAKIHNVNYKKNDYLALSGVDKYEETLKYHLANKSYKKIIVCLDNDEAGIKGADNVKSFVNENYPEIKCEIKLPTLGKDYNDELKGLKEPQERRSFMSDKQVLSGILVSEPKTEKIKLTTGELVDRTTAYVNILHGKGKPATNILVESWNKNANEFLQYNNGDQITMVYHMKEIQYKNGNRKTLYVVDKFDQTNTIAKQFDKLLSLYCNGKIKDIYETHSSEYSQDTEIDNNYENNVEKQENIFEDGYERE